MSSKPARRKEIIDIVKDIKKQQRQNNGISRQNFTGLSSAEFGSVTSSSSGGGSQTANPPSLKGLLRTSGDVMIGPLSLNTKTQTLSGGIIDISKSTGTGYSSYVIASCAAGVNDLNTITGAEHDGQLLFLDAPTTVTIRLKHGVDNVIIPDAADYDVIPDSIAIMIYDATQTAWILVSTFVRDTAGSGGANQTLSNLTSPTAINQHLLFSTTGFNIGDSTNPVNNLFVEELRLKIGTVVTNVPMLTAIDANSMKLNVNTAGKVSFTVLNSEVGRVDASGFTTTLGGTFGGAISAGAATLTASSTLLFANPTTTTLSSTNINIGSGSSTIKFNDDIDMESSDIIDLNDMYLVGKIRYANDPTNTYIDIGSGGGDITLQTNGGTDHINLVASGAGSNIVIDANGTGTITLSLSGVALQTITSTLTSFLTNHVRLPNKSDASRGAASLAGRIIYNTSDGKINIDTGSNWTLADGTIT